MVPVSAVLPGREPYQIDADQLAGEIVTERISLNALCRDIAIINNPSFIRAGGKALNMRGSEVDFLKTNLDRAMTVLRWIRDNEEAIKIAMQLSEGKVSE